MQCRKGRFEVKHKLQCLRAQNAVVCLALEMAGIREVSDNRDTGRARVDVEHLTSDDSIGPELSGVPVISDLKDHSSNRERVLRQKRLDVMTVDRKASSVPKPTSKRRHASKVPQEWAWSTSYCATKALHQAQR